MMALLFRRVGQECADAGKLARCRGCAESLPASFRKKGPQVRCAKIKKTRWADWLAAILPQKIDQPVRRGDVGPHRVRRAAAVVLEVRTPLRGESSGRVNYACGIVSHLRIITARLRPRNISNSEP